MLEHENSLHYWKIHKKFTKKLWDSLSLSSRDIIASDTLGETEMFKFFQAHIRAETNREMQNEDFYFNNWATFFAPNIKKVK